LKKILLTLKNLKTNVNLCYIKITKNKNKSYAEKLRHDKVTPNFEFEIKQPSNSVLELARKFKKESEIDEKIPENDTNKFLGVRNFEDMIIHLENFILENKRGEKIPGSKEIMNHLNIKSEKLRLKLLGKLHEKGVLTKLNVNTYKYNLDYRKENENERYN
jgi:hypothetical protein